MIAVIFEVIPKSGKLDDYLDLAGGLKPELEKIDGFISVERFESLTESGKYLSLSIWRDEEAAENWFSHGAHRSAQIRGRRELFEDYRIRVADILRDYDMAGGRPAT